MGETRNLYAIVAVKREGRNSFRIYMGRSKVILKQILKNVPVPSV
jgi:hypothetical protein